jgi:hypothetical protein
MQRGSDEDAIMLRTFRGAGLFDHHRPSPTLNSPQRSNSMSELRSGSSIPITGVSETRNRPLSRATAL